MLEGPRRAARPGEVAQGGAARLDRLIEDRDDRGVQARTAPPGDARRPAPRRDARPEERLAGVDIADSGDQALVEEGRLDRGRASGEAAVQDIRGEPRAERFGAHARQMLTVLKTGGRDEVDKPETAGVIENDADWPAGSSQVEYDVIVAWIGRRCIIEGARLGGAPAFHRKAAGHAEMHDQGVAGRQRTEKIFAATTKLLELRPDDARRKILRQGDPQGGPTGFHMREPRALHGGGEAAADRFDFGQFGHTRSKLHEMRGGQIAFVEIMLRGGTSSVEQYKYRVFISYSHADERWGDWLQRALETYRVPEALVGTTTPFGPAPRRLTPIFRDRDDLPAAGSLNKAIEEALDASLFQIVICSPQVAKSRWVNEEIRRFKSRHGQDRMLAIIVDGEPGASATPGREAEECFPPALRFRVDTEGNITDEPAEPVAADARPAGDGRRMAVTKLAAGLIGVSLDALVQREAARRARRAQIFTGVSGAVAAIMIVLAGFALNARREAQAMRGHAEDLIEFMLTDLRDKLAPLGQLDILKSVGDEALAYYEAQDLRKLDGDALNRRAKALLLMGNIHQRRQDYDAARAAYKAAMTTTAEQLRRSPNDPERIFDHAQAVFYVGDIDIFLSDLTAAPYYEEYHRLAQRLVEIDPDNPKWRQEMAYAVRNLSILDFYRRKYEEAAPNFERATDMEKALYADELGDAGVMKKIAESLSWEAFNDLHRARFRSALSILDEQIALYDAILAQNPDDFSAIRPLASAYLRKGMAYLALGELDLAEEAWRMESQLSYRLLERDPRDTMRLLYVSRSEEYRSELAQLRGNDAEAVEAADEALAYARRLYEANPKSLNSILVLISAQARRLDAGGDSELLAALAGELDGLVRNSLGSGQRYDKAITHGLAALMHFERARPAPNKSREYASLGVSRFGPLASSLQPFARMRLAEFYLELGQIKEAREIIQYLEMKDFRYPYFLSLNNTLNREE